MYNFPGIFSHGWLCSQGKFGKSVGIFKFHSLGWGSTTNISWVEFRDAAKRHTIQQERQTDTYIHTHTHTLQRTIQPTPNVSCADIKKTCYSLLSCEFCKGRECIRFNHVISELGTEPGSPQRDGLSVPLTWHLAVFIHTHLIQKKEL